MEFMILLIFFFFFINFFIPKWIDGKALMRCVLQNCVWKHLIHFYGKGRCRENTLGRKLNLDNLCHIEIF